MPAPAAHSQDLKLFSVAFGAFIVGKATFLPGAALLLLIQGCVTFGIQRHSLPLALLGFARGGPGRW